MLRACTRSLARSLLSRGFRQWRERALAFTLTEQARQKHIKNVTDLQQEIVHNIKQADGLQSRASEIENETQQAKKRIGEQQRY